jgi:hypothetical protein
VLHADGSIDAAASDTRRAQTTDPGKQPVGREALKPVPEAAVGAVSETLRAAGTPLALIQRRVVMPRRRRVSLLRKRTTLAR